MLISSTPQVFALDVLSYLNREYDGDDDDNDDDDGDDDDDDHYQSKKFSNTFCIYSLKMRNLSSTKLF